MNRSWRVSALGLSALLFLVAVCPCLTGCGRNLFVDSDPEARSKLRYYDNDSAVDTAERRRQGGDMGIGYPIGGGGGSP